MERGEGKRGSEWRENGNGRKIKVRRWECKGSKGKRWKCRRGNGKERKGMEGRGFAGQMTKPTVSKH